MHIYSYPFFTHALTQSLRGVAVFSSILTYNSTIRLCKEILLYIKYICHSFWPSYYPFVKITKYLSFCLYLSLFSFCQLLRHLIPWFQPTSCSEDQNGSVVALSVLKHYILSVPKFTANLYCICLRIDLWYT